MRLTKRVIESLEAREKPYNVFDDEIRGFGVVVQTTGSKSFIIMAKNPQTKKRTTYTLGKYGRLTIEQAREVARQKFFSLALGKDPRVEEKEEQTDSKTITFSTYAQSFMKKAESTLKRNTMISYKQSLDRLLPFFGETPLDQIDMKQYMHYKNSNNESRAWDMSAAFLKFLLKKAHEDMIIKENKLFSIRVKPSNKRESYIKKEIVDRILGLSCRHEYEHVIVLLLLTGCRLNEILHLRWEYVNWEQGVLDLPDSKTGKKVVPLSQTAINKLQELHGLSQGKAGFLFKVRHIQESWRTFKSRHNIPKETRIHDLRHTFASILVQKGVDLYVVAKALGHADIKTTQRYAHLDTRLVSHKLSEAFAGM